MFKIFGAKKKAPVEEAEAKSPSLYEIIKKATSIGGEGAVDFQDMPVIPLGKDDKISFAPGAMDGIFGGMSSKGADWKKVRSAMVDINRRKLTSWQVLDQRLKDISAMSFADTLVRNVDPGEYSEKVYQIFIDVARKSAHYESVKWGIIVAGLNLREGDVPDVILLARYPEFTRYAAVALLRSAELRPGIKNELVRLLPLSRGWGVISLIEYIVREKELIEDKSVQEKVLLHGTENNDGIPMEVAFTIAGAIDLPHFFRKARGDERIFKAIKELMGTLLTEPHPIGGLADLRGWQELLSPHIDLLESMKPDIYVISSISEIGDFLKDESLNYPEREKSLERIRALMAASYSDDIVLRALRERETRYMALQEVRKRKPPHLLDVISDILEDEPEDPAIIDMLATVGERSHIRKMVSLIPKLVDREKRKSVPISFVNMFGPEHRNNYQYSRIVSCLGKLGTPDAIELLLEALGDYATEVRAAACAAVRTLELEKLDAVVLDMLRSKVRERLFDGSEPVSGSAIPAAASLNIKISRGEYEKILEGLKHTPDDEKKELSLLL